MPTQNKKAPAIPDWPDNDPRWVQWHWEHIGNDPLLERGLELDEVMTLKNCPELSAFL